MHAVIQDLRYALRQLRKSPAFTFTIMAVMALGIGANTAIFSLLYALMFRSLPVRDPGQLVELLHRYPGEPHLNGFSWQTYQLMRERNDVFSGLLAAAYEPYRVQVENQEQQTLQGAYVDGGFFPVLGVKPAIGRTIGPNDDREGDQSAVAVVSWTFWNSRFHRDPAILGKQILVNQFPVIIVGVAPRNFSGLKVETSQDIWLPLAARPLIEHTSNATGPDGWMIVGNVNLVARLKPGVSIEQARAEMAVVFASTLDDWARSTNNPFLRKMQFEMEPAGRGLSILREPYGKPLLVLMTIAALLLALACTNVASMLSARGATREPEMSLRVSLGASRFRLLRQGLTESLVLAVAAGLPAIFLAKVGAAGVSRIISSGRPIPGLPRDFVFPVTPDTTVLTFTAVVALATGLLFGLLPTLRVLSISPLALLHPVSRTGETRTRRLFGNGLVSTQVAISVVLLSSAALFLRYLSSLENADLGFQRDHVLLVSLDPSNSGYDTPRFSRALQQLLTRLEAIPGVRSVSLCGASPISGAGANHGVTVEGYTPPPGQLHDVAENWVMENWVAPRYFETLGTPILKGRDFTAGDQGHARVAIVNQTMARHYFGDANPIGRHVTFDGDKQPYEIVGVAGDAKYMEIREATYPTIYLNTFQESWVASQFAIRTSTRPESIIPEVRRAVSDLLKTVPIWHVITLDDQVDASIVPERLLATLSTMFGLLGAMLAAIGLYGLLAFTVARRIKEIGLRIALGATEGDVLRMVVLQALGLVAVGLAVGALLAFWAKRFAASLIHELPAQNAVPIVIGAVGILAVGLLASYIPARRAAKVDPMVALRYE